MTMKVMFSQDPSQARFSLQPSQAVELFNDDEDSQEEEREDRVLQIDSRLKMPFDYVVESQPYLETHMDSRDRLDVVFEQDESSSRFNRRSDAVTPRYVKTEGSPNTYDLTQNMQMAVDNFAQSAKSLGSTIHAGSLHRHKSSAHF